MDGARFLNTITKKKVHYKINPIYTPTRIFVRIISNPKDGARTISFVSKKAERGQASRGLLR